MDDSWFAGSAKIATFSRDEILATKLRALPQRDKGRDLIDLAHAKSVFRRLDLPRVVGQYLGAESLRRLQVVTSSSVVGCCTISGVVIQPLPRTPCGPLAKAVCRRHG
jgi:Nucleotidyl transferase AbiEii toxin, Type IV TA system